MDPELEQTRRLVGEARAGRREAYEELFRIHRAHLERALHGRRSPSVARFDSSDVIQETLIDAVECFDSFEDRGRGSFRRWLTRIALNRMRMSFRHAKRAKRDVRREVPIGRPSEAGSGPAEAFAASVTSPSSAARARDLRERIERALEGLPPDQRDAIQRVKLSGGSIAEAAAAMGRSENAVKKLLARALLALRGRLGDTADTGRP